MAQAKQFEKNALVMGVLSTLEEEKQDLFKRLEKLFGPIEKVTVSMPFSFTDYYNAEMNGEPARYFILFKRQVTPSNLATIKLKTNRLEKRYAKNGNRRINLDPGLLSLSSLILASCKNRSHRIALAKGVYAELTLIYKDKQFNNLPWTYADYASKPVQDILVDFRKIMKENSR